MAVEIVMPRLGLTMEEGTVVLWYKQEGEPVEAGEVLLEVETDKVTQEVESKAAGVVGQILVPAGQTVPIGTPIAIIYAPGEALAPVSALATMPAEIKRKTTGAAFTPGNGKRRASPAARRAARELGLDLSALAGHGPLGRILETDVRRYYQVAQKAASQAESKRLTPVAARMASDLGLEVSRLQGSGPRGLIRKTDLVQETPTPAVPEMASPAERIPLRGARKVMAERMAYSFSTAPHFYLTAEVDATSLVALRQGLLTRVEAACGVRLTYTDVLAYFLAQALREHPLVNAAWDGDAIRLNPEVNLGLAVDSDKGLVVPVIKAIQNLSLGKLAQARSALVEKARQGQLDLEDLKGGTFTLSNLGNSRVDMFNAVLNPPQAAILATGRIRETLVPYEGQPAIRKVIGLSLTCDHRVLDGASGARFLNRLVELIEEPFTAFV